MFRKDCIFYSYFALLAMGIYLVASLQIQRRINVDATSSHRRWYDVVMTACACCVFIWYTHIRLIIFKQHPPELLILYLNLFLSETESGPRIYIYRIQGDCLLISSLPGKALRTLVEACRAIQHAFSKPSLVNLISKDANLVFYYQLSHCFTFQTSDYGIIFDFCIDSASLASFKKCNVIMT